MIILTTPKLRQAFKVTPRHLRYFRARYIDWSARKAVKSNVENMMIYWDWIKEATGGLTQSEFIKQITEIDPQIKFSNYSFSRGRCREIVAGYDLTQYDYRIDEDNYLVYYAKDKKKIVLRPNSNPKQIKKLSEELWESVEDERYNPIKEYFRGKNTQRITSIMMRNNDSVRNWISSQPREEQYSLAFQYETCRMFPYSPLRHGENSDRLFQVDGMPYNFASIDSRLRAKMLEGCQTADLSQCYITLAAHIWDIPKVKAFLNDGKNIWIELGVTGEDKAVCKIAIYALLFGSYSWKTDLECYSKELAEKFASHSIIKALHKARNRRMSDIEKGKVTPINAITGEEIMVFRDTKTGCTRSIMSVELQSCEQYIMQGLYEAAANYGIDILTYEFDGFTWLPKKDYTVPQIQRWLTKKLAEIVKNHTILNGLNITMSFDEFSTGEYYDERKTEEIKGTVETSGTIEERESETQTNQEGYRLGEVGFTARMGIGTEKSICSPRDLKNNDQNENKVVSIKTATRRQCMLTEQEQKLEALRNQFRATQKAKVEQPTCKPQERSTEPLTKSESVSDIEPLEQLHEEYIVDSTAKEKLWKEYKTLQHQLDSFLNQHLALPEKEMMSWALEENVKKHVNIKKENLKEDDINWMYKAKDFLSKRMPNAA